MFLKNSSGEKDAMLFFAAVSFFVTIFCIVAPMFNGCKIWNFVVKVSTPDTSLVIAFLAAGFTSYVTRRNAKLKYNQKDTHDSNEA